MVGANHHCRSPARQWKIVTEFGTEYRKCLKNPPESIATRGIQLWKKYFFLVHFPHGTRFEEKTFYNIFWYTVAQKMFFFKHKRRGKWTRKKYFFQSWIPRVAIDSGRFFKHFRYSVPNSVTIFHWRPGDLQWWFAPTTKGKPNLKHRHVTSVYGSKFNFKHVPGSHLWFGVDFCSTRVDRVVVVNSEPETKNIFCACVCVFYFYHSVVHWPFGIHLFCVWVWFLIYCGAVRTRMQPRWIVPKLILIAEYGHVAHVYRSNFDSGYDPGNHLGISVDFFVCDTGESAKL